MDERISLVHCTGTCRGYVGLGKHNGHGAVQWQEGLESLVLDDANTSTVIRPGYESSAGST